MFISLARYGRLRSAVFADLDFVCRLIGDGANHGHYSASLCDPLKLQEFGRALEQVIRYGIMVRIGERGCERLCAQLLIYEHGESRSAPTGFVLATEKEPGSGDRALEIYMTSIAPEVRHQGYGSKMISLLQHIRPEGGLLYARCYPASRLMATIFRQKGFTESGVLAGRVKQFVFSKPHTVVASPLRAPFVSSGSMRPTRG